MPNIASLLKDEITRLARKELRANTENLKKAVATYRSEIAALKRRVDTLERQAKRTAKVVSSVQPAQKESSDAKHRFSAKGLATHRQRLGLSAADYAALLGVSALSVYKWEGGQARPRARYLPGIAAIRSMSKREAAARLEELAK
jgi:DNA-binding transcriptional regulator YiaG